MGRKIHRLKLDVNNLFRNIEDVVAASRSKVAKESGFGIGIGLELLRAYLRMIGERAIELGDEVLIDLLLDLHVLKEEQEDGK